MQVVHRHGSSHVLCVGILVLALGVAIGTGLAWCRIGTSELVLPRTSPVALGGLPCEYQ